MLLRADSGHRVIERRTFLGVITSGLLAAPLAAGAETPGRVTKLGILSAVNPRTTTFTEAMIQRLRELGYVEGQNLVVEFRNAEGDVSRLPTLAAELVRLNVDVILAPGPEVTLHATRKATTTLPIVVAAVGAASGIDHLRRRHREYSDAGAVGNMVVAMPEWQ